MVKTFNDSVKYGAVFKKSKGAALSYPFNWHYGEGKVKLNKGKPVNVKFHGGLDLWTPFHEIYGDLAFDKSGFTHSEFNETFPDSFKKALQILKDAKTESVIIPQFAIVPNTRPRILGTINSSHDLVSKTEYNIGIDVNNAYNLRTETRPKQLGQKTMYWKALAQVNKKGAFIDALKLTLDLAKKGIALPTRSFSLVSKDGKQWDLALSPHAIKTIAAYCMPAKSPMPLFRSEAKHLAIDERRINLRKFAGSDTGNLFRHLLKCDLDGATYNDKIKEHADHLWDLRKQIASEEWLAPGVTLHTRWRAEEHANTNLEPLLTEKQLQVHPKSKRKIDERRVA